MVKKGQKVQIYCLISWLTFGVSKNPSRHDAAYGVDYQAGLRILRFVLVSVKMGSQEFLCVVDLFKFYSIALLR